MKLNDICPLFIFAAMQVSPNVKALSAAPKLKIVMEEKERVFSRETLLKRNDLVSIEVTKDPSYPKIGKRSYLAIPLIALFANLNLPEASIIQFYCLDGFSAPLEKTRILATDAQQSHAYIAIEDPAHPWPKLEKKNVSAGPFYLIWDHPELSKIGQEEWPFQLAGFKIYASFESKFPHLMPEASLKKQSPEQMGLAVFRKNCFSCHTLNGEGDSKVGPDLNLPMNPVEYFQKAALLKLIRDPKSVRQWEGSQMPGFSLAALSDADFKNLEAYLLHMSSRKLESREPPKK